jgi:predicted deacetylase
VALGRRLLAAIELDPRGFVAPGYAYTRALRGALADQFEWFADLRRVYTRAGPLNAPALCLGSSTALKRQFSPAIVQAIARTSGAELMRIDIHPADFDLPAHIRALASLLERAEGREAVTYDQLV